MDREHTFAKLGVERLSATTCQHELSSLCSGDQFNAQVAFENLSQQSGAFLFKFALRVDSVAT